MGRYAAIELPDETIEALELECRREHQVAYHRLNLHIAGYAPNIATQEVDKYHGRFGRM